MDIIDSKYVRLLSARLEKPKWQRADLLGFRCPICGDSAKNPNKRRGFIYTKSNKTLMFCHNCGASMSFQSFLKLVDPNLYNEYRLEKYQENFPQHKKEVVVSDDVFQTGFKSQEEVKTEKELIFSDIPSIWELSESHPARIKVEQRLLSESIPVLYAKNFPIWASSTFKRLENWKQVKPHPRFILPMYDSSKTLLGFCARAFGNESVKYCNLNLHPDREFFYGLDRIDRTKRVFVVEGAIDSLMIDNAIAAMCSTLERVNVAPEQVLIYDNQPRNKEICSLIHKSIQRGRKVCLWPSDFPYKDLNEARQAGMTKKQLDEIINGNIVQGLKAELKFGTWKKV